MALCAHRMHSSVAAGGRPAPLRTAGVSRAPLVVQAVQDLKGKVVSTKMDKAVVVEVERLQVHEKYFKRVRLSKRYTAHDAVGLCAVGDYVRLEGTRPLSKTKRFVVAEVIRAAT